MKSEDLQKVVLLEHPNRDYPIKIFRDLSDAFDLSMIKRQ